MLGLQVWHLSSYIVGDPELAKLCLLCRARHNRPSMATHMLENGADIRHIQMILGHVNLSSTEIYTQVSTKKLKQMHMATHSASFIGTHTINLLRF